jgi:hypothetical protein
MTKNDFVILSTPKGIDDDEKMVLSYYHFVINLVIDRMIKYDFVILSNCIGGCKMRK